MCNLSFNNFSYFNNSSQPYPSSPESKEDVFEPSEESHQSIEELLHSEEDLVEMKGKNLNSLLIIEERTENDPCNQSDVKEENILYRGRRSAYIKRTKKVENQKIEESLLIKSKKRKIAEIKDEKKDKDLEKVEIFDVDLKLPVSKKLKTEENNTPLKLRLKKGVREGSVKVDQLRQYLISLPKEKILSQGDCQTLTESECDILPIVI